MEDRRHIVQVYVGAVSQQYEALSIEVHKSTVAQEIVTCIAERLEFLNPNSYYLAEVIHNANGEECKERRIAANETPACLQGLWPQNSTTQENDTEGQEYRFCLREKPEQPSAEPSAYESQIIRDYFKRFLHSEHKEKEHPDLCQLSNLTEETLLHNLKVRFDNGLIYTYVGSILISVNPFKYYPIYNPKYVKIYQNHRVGELPPHIFAIADSAYHSMVKQRRNQCIVISGESGSGKTESTLFLLHHLTMLSQKGSHGSGVEQTILSSGPVLEAFGNAKTKHNNNSSRFGKFIQVSYKENGLVQGACVQKYLLEKSRICSQALNERSYHVFYYLLAGASPQERSSLNLLRPKDYNYLNQSKCYSIEGCDEQFEFLRLKQSMEMVGFTAAKQQRLFSVLSAVLLLGNVEFTQSRGAYQHDESVAVRNMEVVESVAALLGVAFSTLLSALTAKQARVQGEVLIINYRQNEAVVARNALAKCLYGALFDWIVLQLNYSLLSLKDGANDKSANSIGVLDIFGFEDFPNQNRFEQFCINYANERLQRYFNQHVFEYEQEEYQREGIAWTHIEFQDNVDCLALIEAKRTGLLCTLDDQCNFPGSSDETFLEKINSVHKDNPHYDLPQRRESAFIINHYAGPVKYQVSGFREKNLDLMRPELITVLKHSQYSVVRELAGADPVAVYRWAILRTFFRAVNAFKAPASKNEEGSNRRGSSSRSGPKMLIDQSRINAALENSHNSRMRRTRYSRSSSSGLGSRHRSSAACSSARHKNLQTVKALVQRTQARGGRKQPHTVTAQFQLSLQALMDTLSHANPYFIRCIKSNANKEANVFDDALVMRQLRYTGMLETVRIRQAGYNVRLTYDEFIQHYRILLPKGLLSSQADVKAFMNSGAAGLASTEHQEGRTRIFMRETEREKLDSLLHQTILTRILLIQRWYRAVHQRRVYLSLRASALRIQCCVRRWLAEQRVARLQLQHRAATLIQRVWRGYRQRCLFLTVRRAVLGIQSAFRGRAARTRFKLLVEASCQRRNTYSTDEPQSDVSSSLSTLMSSLAVSEADLPTASSTTTPTTTAPPTTVPSATVPCTTASPIQKTRDVSLDTAKQKSSKDGDTEGAKINSNHRLEFIRRSSTDDTNIEKQSTSAGQSPTKSYARAQERRVSDLKNISSERRKASEDLSGHKQSSNDIRPLPKPESDKSFGHRASLPGPATTETPSQRVSGGEVPVKKELARRYHSSGDVVEPRVTPATETSVLCDDGALVPLQRPPPRRRSSANVSSAGQAAAVGATGIRRQSELYRAGRRVSTQLTAPQDLDIPASCESSPPSSPGEGSLGSESRPPGKTRRFRHRPYPKLQHSFMGDHASSVYASEESLAGIEERLPVASLDPESEAQPQLPPRPLAGAVVPLGKSGSLLSESALLPTSKPKYNIKRTFKNIIGKNKEGGSSLYGTDDDASSVGEGSGPVPLTPTQYPSLPPAYSIPFDTAIASDTLATLTGEEVTGQESDSLSAPEIQSSSSTADLKKILASSPHGLKQSQLKKGDQCSVCCKFFNSRLFNSGYKCVVCRRVFHQRCLETSIQVPCVRGLNVPSLMSAGGQELGPGPSPPLPHRSSVVLTSTGRKHSQQLQLPPARAPGLGEGTTRAENHWNLRGSSQFEDRSIDVIKNKEQLQALEKFISSKLHELENNSRRVGQEGRTAGASEGPAGDKDKKDSQVDQVFMQSLRTFKEMLVTEYSGRSAEQLPVFSYKDLTDRFQKMMSSILCNHESGGSSFPVTMGVNAFRGFLNEFLAEGGASKKRRRRGNRRKKKEKKPAEEVVHGSHKFTHLMVNIATSCEVCNSFLWLSAKGLTCRTCKLTCHEKCLQRVELHCGLNSGKAVVVSASSPKTKTSTGGTTASAPMNRVFGVALDKQQLVDGVPYVVDKLIQAIERDGLFTEGLYRKSAATSKGKEVKRLIEEDCSAVQFSELPIHVLTTLLKAFLRELPEPLLTFDAYDPLLHASLLPNAWEQSDAAYKIIRNLPTLNFQLVSRLFYHLAKVAHLEQHNRMNCNSLAIVFSPCIIRSNRHLPVTESLSDVGKQTLVIERAISSRLQAYRETLNHIDVIDSKAASMEAELGHLRKIKQRNSTPGSNVKVDPRLALQEYKIEEQLSNLDNEREMWEERLPEILPGGSSEEDMLDLSRAGSEEDVMFDGRGSRKDSVCGERGFNRNSVKSKAEKEALPQPRRQGLGRQLSDDTQQRQRNDSLLQEAAGKENVKRRRHLAPSSRTLPPDDEDDDTVMV
ncbi:Protein kinase C-like phorbol ester/diacylglycerol-binding domain [Trinorchestia longiramus]|nr:Protein kinase C-like phorbol ester/diacylglycerol-binding domain [Trinorchestia longiramus]